MTTPEICKQCGKLAFPGETVTIPAVEYEELRRFKAARTQPVSRLESFRLDSSSRIARDPELAQFILDCAETMVMKDVRKACIARFGADRVPHRTTIGSFVRAQGARPRK